MRAVFGPLIRPGPALWIFFLVLAAPAPARAGFVTFTFTGSVTNVDSALAGNFTPGDTLSGSFTIDTSVAALSGSTSTAAVFNALTNVDLAVGAFTASSSGAPAVHMANNDPATNVDRFAVASLAADGLAGGGVSGISIQMFGFLLEDQDQTAFSNALVLPHGLDLADFETRKFMLRFTTSRLGETATLSGTIDTLGPGNAVPAPPSLVLASVGGLACLGLRGWRRALPNGAVT
ncbi:MAG TPA: hypothetical protein VLM40_10375 [Gemmata sp.]|nr:hypothetical protein [Gemmata sp.]